MASIAFQHENVEIIYIIEGISIYLQEKEDKSSPYKDVGRNFENFTF